MARRTTIDKGATPAELILRHCADILASPGMRVEAECVQHGTTSVLAHSAAVTAFCVVMARELRIPVDERALLRGALLHDYFLYDWHVPDPSHRLHGLFHPRTACRNAVRDFGIGELEQGMVRRHMFPLTPLPPTSREAAILCVADKFVAGGETIHGLALRLRSLGRRHADA